MVNCEVLGCENKTSCKSPEQLERESNGLKISFFRFPHTEERRKYWVEALKRNDWSPDEKSVICSDHFSRECLERTDAVSYITKHAVPSVFPTDIKPVVKNFEFIPFSNPNEILRINRSTLEKDDPLNMAQYDIKIKIETDECKMETTNDLQTFSDTSAQTEDSVRMKEMISDSRLEIEEEEKTIIYRKKIRTLQQQIRKQDIVIQNLEDKIAEIRAESE